LITGAGIGGLIAALALQQRGFEVALYEQAHDLREVGAGVQISPNGTRVLYSLGLADAIRAVAVEPTGKEVRLWNSGATWPLFDLGPTCVARYGSPYLMFHRGDLQMALVKAVREANPAAIHLGASVTQSTETEDGVVIDLVDGRTVAGSLLVGADGVHSTTRSALFGTAKARFTGCMAWRGVVPMERLPGHLARQVGVNWIGPGRHVVTYPLRGGKLMNFVGVVEHSDWTTESWTARGTREECARDFAGWHPDVHALIDNIDDHYRWALLSRATIERWTGARTVLLGDACHPMLPFMAQGAVMAIEDGLVLARCLADNGTTDPAAAFRQYERERVERANRSCAPRNETASCSIAPGSRMPRTPSVTLGQSGTSSVCSTATTGCSPTMRRHLSNRYRPDYVGKTSQCHRSEWMPVFGSAQPLLLVPCGAPLFLELDRLPSGYVLPEEWAAAEPYLGHPVQIGPVLQYKGMAAC
jgi:salicylate hydroxylase